MKRALAVLERCNVGAADITRWEDEVICKLATGYKARFFDTRIHDAEIERRTRIFEFVESYQKVRPEAEFDFAMSVCFELYPDLASYRRPRSVVSVIRVQC